jgi:hypothetical protein
MSHNGTHASSGLPARFHVTGTVKPDPAVQMYNCIVNVSTKLTKLLVESLNVTIVSSSALYEIFFFSEEKKKESRTNTEEN